MYYETAPYDDKIHTGVGKMYGVLSTFVVEVLLRGHQPGREDHEFDPRLGNFFLSVANVCL